MTTVTIECPAVAIEQFDGLGTNGFLLLVNSPTIVNDPPTFGGDVVIGVVDVSTLSKGLGELVTLVTEIGQPFM